MPTPSEQAQIKAVQKEIRKLVEDVTVDATLETSKQLFEKTPKDTTFTASNWNPSVGVADGTVRGIKDARINREKKSAVILTGYKLNQGRTFVSSGVRHIERLNAAGSPSLGVPSAFVQRAIRDTVRISTRKLRTGRLRRRGGGGG